METSEHSQLPEFEVKLFHIDEPAGSYDMLEVRCTRTGCGQDHWVGLAWRVFPSAVKQSPKRKRVVRRRKQST